MLERISDLQNAYEDARRRAQIASSDLTERGAEIHAERISALDAEIAKLIHIREVTVERFENASEILTESLAEMARTKKRIQTMRYEKKLLRIAELQSELLSLELEIEHDRS